MLKTVYPNCAGLDVHKKFVTVCRLTVDCHGLSHAELREFSTMSDDLEALATWLAAGGVTHVAMESTGVYWQTIHNILEGRFEVFLVNAQSIKRMPGRKTDMKDAEWIATLMQHGLLQRSLIPDKTRRELRDLTRYRQSLSEEHTRFANRLQKVLEGTNLLSLLRSPRTSRASRLRPFCGRCWKAKRMSKCWPKCPRAACATSAPNWSGP